MVPFVYNNLNSLLPIAFAVGMVAVLLASGKFRMLWIFEVSRAEHPVRFWMAITVVLLFAVMGIALMLSPLQVRCCLHDRWALEKFWQERKVLAVWED
jgi:multisubunit Na+/H+ antiporter MnhB subunit